MHARSLLLGALVAPAALLVTHPANAWINYCNSSGGDLWATVSVRWNSDKCNGYGTDIPGGFYYAGSYENGGWYHISQGQCVTVSGINLQDSNHVGLGSGLFRFFATNSNWSLIWDSGNSSSMIGAVENSGFDICDPFGDWAGGLTVPSPYWTTTMGVETTGNYNNFTFTFHQ